MKQVYNARTSLDASLVRAYFESCGVPSIIRGEFLWTLRGFMPMTREMLPTVWVEDYDYEKAIELLKAWEASQRDQTHSLPSWSCKSCGEVNEGQFTNCWNCNGESG